MASTYLPQASRVVAQTDYWVRVYRRTWKGSVITSFLSPLLYVVAMGVMLGTFVASDPAAMEGAPSYLAFVVPGLVAAQSMQIVFGECTYPVMSMLKWQKVYYSMIATPLGTADIVAAQLGFVFFRVATVSAVFMAILIPFGVYADLVGALLALGVQLLIGFAFATPLIAITAAMRDENAFALVFRLGMIPMFLFSGAFFPIGNLHPALEMLAQATPLWHGVDLTRMLMLGTVDASTALVHVGYLLAVGLVGWACAVRLLQRRLVS